MEVENAKALQLQLNKLEADAIAIREKKKEKQRQAYQKWVKRHCYDEDGEPTDVLLQRRANSKEYYQKNKTPKRAVLTDAILLERAKADRKKKSEYHKKYYQNQKKAQSKL